MPIPQTRRESEIWQACDDLWASGLSFSKLTGDNITARLLALGYKKGSPNQIYQYRKTWAKSRGIQELTAEAAPALLTDPISRAAALVRDEIVADAHAMIAQAKAEAQERIDILEQQYEQLHKAYTELTQQHDALQQDYQGLTAQHAALSQQLHQEQQQRAVSEAQVHSTAQQLQQLRETSEQRIAEQRRLYEQQLATLTEENHSATRHHQATITGLRDAIEAQRHQFITQLDAQRIAFHKLEKQYETALAQERATQHVVATLKQNLNRAEAAIATYQADYHSLAAAFEDKTKALLSANLDLKHTQQQLQQSQQQLAQCSADRHAANLRMDRVEDSLRQLTAALARHTTGNADDTP